MSIYRHISAERAHCDFPVSLMCELLGVSESGLWAWSRRAPSDRELSDAWLTERIRQVHAAAAAATAARACTRSCGVRASESARSAWRG